jgi:RimJ/RimL family protein N-acetyltransferase
VTGTLTGARTTLRPVEDADLESIGVWWPEAAGVVRGVAEPGTPEELRELIASTEAFVIASADDAEPIGLLAYVRPAKGWVEFRFVAMAAGERGWGHGSEAVFLVEESAAGSRFAADVYHGNGLGVYFWTRIGYRPAAQGEVAWREREADDMITMVRGEI